MLSSENSLKTPVTLLELTEASVYNNRLVVKHFGNLTLQKALESPSKSIGFIAKKDENKAILCITNLFIAVSHYFDKVLPLSKAEIIATELLYKYEYRSLKLEDLVVICFRLKEADIFKLTIAKILREISKYSKEREQLAIRLNKRKDFSINADIEERLKKSFIAALPNADKLASKRNRIETKFKQ